MRRHVRCGIVQHTPFLHVSQIFQRCKSDANKQNIEMKLNLTWKVKLNQLNHGMFDELSSGQAKVDRHTDTHTQAMTIPLGQKGLG